MAYEALSIIEQQYFPIRILNASHLTGRQSVPLFNELAVHQPVISEFALSGTRTRELATGADALTTIPPRQVYVYRFYMSLNDNTMKLQILS